MTEVDPNWPRLASALAGTRRGPILVLGGGPSAATDCAELETMEREHGLKLQTVISANEHGFTNLPYTPEFAVCLDEYHGVTRKPMESLLRQHGAKIVTSLPFGDYRLPEFRGNMNTGLVSIYVGLLMGGHPVIVTGLDFYRMKNARAGTYHHDAGAISNSNKKDPDNFEKQIKNMIERCGGTEAPIRPMSGPLLAHYPKFDPNEKMPAWAGSHYTEFMLGLQTIYLENGRKKGGFRGGSIMPGQIVPMGDREALGYLGAHQSRVIWPHGHPLTKFDRSARHDPVPPQYVPDD